MLYVGEQNLANVDLSHSRQSKGRGTPLVLTISRNALLRCSVNKRQAAVTPETYVSVWRAALKEEATRLCKVEC